MIMCIGAAPLTTVLNKFLAMRINGKIAFISHWNYVSLIPLEKCVSKCLRGELQIYAKKIEILKFWECLLYEV